MRSRQALSDRRAEIAKILEKIPLEDRKKELDRVAAEFSVCVDTVENALREHRIAIPKRARRKKRKRG
jgi:hypothetical protein